MQCNAMRCNAGGLGTSIGGEVRAGVWASLIGSATGGQSERQSCRGSIR